MANLRLNSSASIEITDAGVLFRSDLGMFQIEGRDIQIFVNAILPLLDGTRNKEALADKIKGIHMKVFIPCLVCWNNMESSRQFREIRMILW